jgi:transcription-repair coupling factor (superfamily II helicase)
LGPLERIAIFDPNTQDTIRTVGSLTVRILSGSGSIPIGLSLDTLLPIDYFFFIGEERLATSFNSLLVEARSLYRQAFVSDRSVAKPTSLLFRSTNFSSRPGAAPSCWSSKAAAPKHSDTM